VQKFKREGFDWYVRMVEDYQAIWQRSVSSLGDNLTRTESQKLRAKREAAKIGNRRPRANSRNIATSLAKYVTGERRSESRDSRDSISEEAIKVTKGGDDDDWDLVDYQDQSLAQERVSIPETTDIKNISEELAATFPLSAKWSGLGGIAKPSSGPRVGSVGGQSDKQKKIDAMYDIKHVSSSTPEPIHVTRESPIPQRASRFSTTTNQARADSAYQWDQSYASLTLTSKHPTIKFSNSLSTLSSIRTKPGRARSGPDLSADGGTTAYDIESESDIGNSSTGHLWQLPAPRMRIVLMVVGTR
jgi:hypothetical protein